MHFEELLSRVALAFGIGLLIGLERGWRPKRSEQRLEEFKPFAMQIRVRQRNLSGRYLYHQHVRIVCANIVLQ